MTDVVQTKGLLKDKCAVVTGANRGIGKQICESFLGAGACVIATARDHTDDFLSWAEVQNESASSELFPVYLDLEEGDSIKRAIKDIRSISSKIDVLVNNAGIGFGALFQMTSIEDMRRVFEVNFFAQILLTQQISRLMMRYKTGSIINISSVSAERVDVGTMTYGCSKMALNRATKSMAVELGDAGIRVNAIAPGVTKTDMADQMSDKAREMLIQSSVSKQIATPQNIADVAVFLASDLSAHISGQIINVDGGII